VREGIFYGCMCVIGISHRSIVVSVWKQLIHDLRLNQLLMLYVDENVKQNNINGSYFSYIHYIITIGYA